MAVACVECCAALRRGCRVAISETPYLYADPLLNDAMPLAFVSQASDTAVGDACYFFCARVTFSIDATQVIVLVSGGSDSVALLLALQQAANTFKPALRVEAVHFNHALRGQDSEADEDFVVDTARRLGVPLHVRRWKGEHLGTGTSIHERRFGCENIV